MTTLTGKVAIVTGGGQGLGEATALALSRAGATVVCADIQTDKAKRVAEGITATGGQAGQRCAPGCAGRSQR
jgi:NAD(P)-dependent dehydrogenase (short-subunit alcohol dehydrogenase family)